MKKLLILISICGILGVTIGFPQNEANQIEENNISEAQTVAAVASDTFEVVEEDAEDDKRIISGSKTKSMSESPYMGSLLRQSGSLKKICGSSIVHKRWVLTAAHCVSSPDYTAANYYVKAGSLDPFDQKSGQLNRVAKIFVHPCYMRGSYESVNDIALLKMAAEFKFNSDVQAISLPKADHNVEKIASGQVHGWGAIDRKDHSITSPTLLHAPGRAVAATVCTKAGWHLDNKKVCLQKSSQSVCPGDSGGPFTQKDANGNLVIAGIVSESSKICGEKPVVFTRVSAFIPWISTVSQSEPSYIQCYEPKPSWL